MEAFRHSVELEPPAETNGSAAQPDPGSLAESTGHPALARAWLLWRERRFILRACLTGVLFSILLALVIPPRYRSTARLMPPDTEPVPGMAMLSAISASSGGLGFLANDLLGVKSSGALFVAVLRSRTHGKRRWQHGVAARQAQVGQGLHRQPTKAPNGCEQGVGMHGAMDR